MQRKKIFLISNDNFDSFPGTAGGIATPQDQTIFYNIKFGGNASQLIPPENGQTYVTTEGTVAPLTGKFGAIPLESKIKEYESFGAILPPLPSGATPILRNSSFSTRYPNSVNGIVMDNLVIISDVNWYVNNSNNLNSGFANEGTGCSNTPNSILFCNIFDYGIQWVLSHETKNN